MKLAGQLLGIGLSLFAVSSYGCEPKPSNTNRHTIITHALWEKEKPATPTVKIALLLDTSNSMDGLINQAKSQLWDIVNKFSYAQCGDDRPTELQIALYQYGNDHLSSQEGYIQQVLDFSQDLDEISEKLFSLTTNGGEEYCGKVIQKSLTQLDWGKNPDHLKMIFIAGNEPFTQGKLSYMDAAYHAKEKDVIVNTIFCGNYEQGINTKWKHGARLTGGEYTAIDHNKKVVHIATPYDDIIIQLNSKLNGTYISYGLLGVEKIKAQHEQDDNALEMEEAVAVKRAVSKSSHLYKNATWDLVDAYAGGDISLSKIDKKVLPPVLQDKTTGEIESFILEKNKERKKIQQEIQELNAKREAFIVKNQKENSKGSLQDAMMEAIEKQAARKNYTWEK